MISAVLPLLGCAIVHFYCRCVVLAQKLRDISIEDGHNKQEIDSSASNTKYKDKSHISSAIRWALDNDKVEILLQPIVSLPQRKVKYFECLARVRDQAGVIYTPNDFLSLAHESDMITKLDSTVILRCLRILVDRDLHDESMKFFCNISCDTIRNSQVFTEIISIINKYDGITNKVIFELSQQVLLENYTTMSLLLAQLKSAGCIFSIDQIDRVDLDFELLSKCNLKYLKIHNRCLLDLARKTYGHDMIIKFIQQCREYNITAIVTHLEDEESMVEINDFKFHFAQGFLFGSHFVMK